MVFYGKLFSRSQFLHLLNQSLNHFDIWEFGTPNISHMNLDSVYLLLYSCSVIGKKCFYSRFFYVATYFLLVQMHLNLVEMHLNGTLEVEMEN